MLGQNQECYGACFSPSQSLDGTMAAVRVWNTVRTAVRPRLLMQHIFIAPVPCLLVLSVRGASSIQQSTRMTVHVQCLILLGGFLESVLEV